MEEPLEILKNEMVKPSAASTHPKSFSLSLLDQIFPAFHMPLLLFFRPLQPPPSGQQYKAVATHLKAALSQTLDEYYPLAGRLVDESTICCNDQGIVFLETKVNAHLSDVLASSSDTLNRLLPNFLPPSHLQATGPQPISTLVPFSVQVNVFLCGGIVIGSYALHKMLDAVSLGTFYKHWSAQFKHDLDGVDMTRPNFKATVRAFPPLVDGVEGSVFVPDLYKDVTPESPTPTTTTTVVVKSFKFNMAAITRLKTNAASAEVATPSRFEALAAFIWQQMVLAAPPPTKDLNNNNNNNNNNNTVLSISVNMRPMLKPALPKQSIGNVVTNARVVGNQNESNLKELVKIIHKELTEINQKITKVYQGEKGVETLCKERKDESEGVMKEKGHKYYQISSICYNGLSEADFGMGVAPWIVPLDGRKIPPTLRNFILFTDYKHPTIVEDSGIEAWLYLDTNHMSVLESSPVFLAFASPNYSP